MARTVVRLTDNFPKVKQASRKTVLAAREAALKAGTATAKAKVRELNSSRDYNLPDSVGSEKQGLSAGLVYLGEADEFWWRFFEYGTVYISAFPMIRPAGAAMNKTFTAFMLRNLDTVIKREAKA